MPGKAMFDLHVSCATPRRTRESRRNTNFLLVGFGYHGSVPMDYPNGRRTPVREATSFRKKSLRVGIRSLATDPRPPNRHRPAWTRRVGRSARPPARDGPRRTTHLGRRGRSSTQRYCEVGPTRSSGSSGHPTRPLLKSRARSIASNLISIKVYPHRNGGHNTSGSSASRAAAERLPGLPESGPRRRR